MCIHAKRGPKISPVAFERNLLELNLLGLNLLELNLLELNLLELMRCALLELLSDMRIPQRWLRSPLDCLQVH